MLVVIGARAPRLRYGERGRLVAVLPDLRVPATTSTRASTDPADGEPPVYLTSTASRTRRSSIRSKPRRASSTTRRYAWFPDRVFERVLIIGAGSGTDTALALAKGAKHVDAVEIDPKLAQIGRDFHPEGVYQDPRVTVHVNDGRAFLNSSNEKYDLVVYALTDSLTLVSSTAGVRLESFLFTEESMRGGARPPGARRHVR